MGESTTNATVFECRECGSVSLGDSETTCCGAEMVSADATPVEHPELAVVLREVFGVSRTGLTICVCLMEAGDSTAAELADRLDLDRSTVARQLNHLVEIGLLDKRQRLLTGGGYVHVYSPVEVEEVRERLTVGLYAWVAEALDLVEEIDRRKVKALARSDGGEEAAGIYWDG
ncbi:helix-turn-helix domain-containing protein [Halorussus marinus]|uniref:helix-turn-helix domain-containing protein n=1 Tax=Halorussus marinus TaxID=2505976 RepID=UPI00106E622E|nr:helix-turn-helix domain-containing protein [Halorussus marinus]